MGRLDRDADGWYLDPALRQRQYQAEDMERKRLRLCDPGEGKGEGVTHGSNMEAVLEILTRSIKEMSILQEEVVSLRRSVLSLSKKRPRGDY